MVGVSVRHRKTSLPKFRRLPKLLRDAQVTEMERAVKLVERDLRNVSFSGKKGHDAFWGVTGAAGSALGSRTGHTRRSIVSRVFVGSLGTSVTGTIGSPLPHTRVHEEGGTVRGKPWLRIPTRLMKTPSGADRLAGRSARSLPNTTIITSRKGNPWIIQTGSDLPLERRLLYMLVREVTFRPRRMFKACLNRMRPTIQRLFSGRFTAVVRSP